MRANKTELNNFLFFFQMVDTFLMIVKGKKKKKTNIKLNWTANVTIVVTKIWSYAKKLKLNKQR